MSDYLKSKKLSMPNLNYNPRKSVLKKDSKFEFDAPKYHDFSKRDIEKEKRLHDENYIDYWFFIDHRKAPMLNTFTIASLNSNEILSTDKSNMNKSDIMKKRQSAIRKENEKNHIKNQAESNNSSENNITIEEMLKIHNEQVKKRKYSQFEKENISIDRNIGNVKNSLHPNHDLNDSKNPLYRTKKKVSISKRSINNKFENIRVNQNSFMANIKNLNKNNCEFNQNKSQANTNNLPDNNLLISGKKPNNYISKKATIEQKTAMRTAHKKDSDSLETRKEKTTKKIPFRVNRFDSNQINASNYNSSINFNTKNLKRNFSTSNENFKDTKSIKNKNIQTSTSIQSRTKSSTSTSVTYCPRLFSASVMKKWEKMKGISWYKLSPSSRNMANQEITELLKNKNL